MIGLCIMETYHMYGKYRLETFKTMEHLEQYRAKHVNPSATTWVLGNPMPKRKQLEFR